MMTTTDAASQSPPAAHSPAAASGIEAPTDPILLTTPLPHLPTTFPAQEITRRLDTAARRGRMPGYTTGGPNGVLFEVRDFGAPFEGVLRGRLEGGSLRFAASIQPRLPVITVLILLATIWPGVWFTESALASIFTSAEYMWKWTYWWYLPLAVLSAPWVMWSVMTRSRASIHAAAHELIGKIAAELETPPAPSPSVQPTPR